MSRNRNEAESSPDWPHWYDGMAPLGSAVRYLAALSPLFNWVGIYVVDGDELVLGPYMGEASEHVRIPIGKGICGMAVASDRDLNIPDVSKEPQYLACSLKTRSELVVLIRKDGKVVGQVDIDSHSFNAFGPEQEFQVRQIAEELGKRWPVDASRS